jgi:HD-GYP domain-containing protein (c-di-GMP phosphodiesterase class II)
VSRRPQPYEFPLTARIVAVADALDALTSDRPYRKARPLAAALVELREHVGAQFCPDVVGALEAVVVEEPDALGFEPRPQPAVAAA